ncbi:hypothetical protein TWF696_003500 [Orbilia brochopaga]|uniref:Uncharacterized protein n=1 Tax=Orbilia brochopaga TaxID=3140254 RepID=A0AAV9U0B4_9PEZI
MNMGDASSSVGLQQTPTCQNAKIYGLILNAQTTTATLLASTNSLDHRLPNPTCATNTNQINHRQLRRVPQRQRAIERPLIPIDMCHTIYTFSKVTPTCPHLDISDDVKQFPPCICNAVRASIKLPRACNACVRYSAPGFRQKHKKMVNMQIDRFRRLCLPWAEIHRLVPRWKRVVGLGIKVSKDWAESDEEDDGEKIVLDEAEQAAIMEAIEDDSATQMHGTAQEQGSDQDKLGTGAPEARERS